MRKLGISVADATRITVQYFILNNMCRENMANSAITLCGIKYQWADSKYHHQVDCDECKKLKNKQKEKPDYPHKIIIRMRKPKNLVVQVQTSQFHRLCLFPECYLSSHEMDSVF